MIDPHALLAIVGSSLLGSLHCAGMCGPLAVAACGSTPPRSVPIRLNGRVLLASGITINTTAYHTGRLVGYVSLGAVAGSLGAGVNLAGRLAGLQQAAMVIASGAVILMGLGMLLTGLGLRVHSRGVPAIWRPLAGAWQAVNRWRPTPRAGAIGLLSGLLPCGWLWVFVVAAAGSGTAPGGAATMLAFWIGTVPVLTLIGSGLARALAPVRARIPVIAGLAIIALGGLMFATHAATHGLSSTIPGFCNAP